jgi:hypothetical protein
MTETKHFMRPDKDRFLGDENPFEAIRREHAQRRVHAGHRPRRGGPPAAGAVRLTG